MLKVYRANKTAEIPAYATEGSACFDIKSCFKIGDRIKGHNPWNKEISLVVKNIAGKAAFQIPPEHRALVPTGLIFDVPENHVLSMYVRSSVALKRGLIIPNGVGIIDSDYIEESYIILYNISDSLVVISNGERLAQAKLEKLSKYTIEEILEAPQKKTSRVGGFGSTGE